MVAVQSVLTLVRNPNADPMGPCFHCRRTVPLPRDLLGNGNRRYRRHPIQYHHWLPEPPESTRKEKQ